MRYSYRWLAVFGTLLGTVACSPADRGPASLQQYDFRFPPKALVAHALGGIEGKNYSNSLEALEGTLARGGRFLEVDLSFTANGDLVCFHTQHEKHLGLETLVTEMTTTEFLTHRYRDRFTLIDLDTLLHILVKHRDVYLVIDCKHDFDSCMATVLSVAEAAEPALVGRMVPQIFKPDQWRDIARMEAEYGSFATVIFTLYNTRIDDDAVVEFVQERGVPVVTMSRKRFNPDLVARLAAIDVDSLVHTVNKPAEMIGFTDEGVRGLYSDRFVRWDEVLGAEQPTTAPRKERP